MLEQQQLAAVSMAVNCLHAAGDAGLHACDAIQRLVATKSRWWHASCAAAGTTRFKLQVLHASMQPDAYPIYLTHNIQATSTY